MSPIWRALIAFGVFNITVIVLSHAGITPWKHGFAFGNAHDFALVATVLAWNITGFIQRTEPMTPNLEAAAEIARLNAALRYEENRSGRIGTHGPDCHTWGPRHYECAMREIERQREATHWRTIDTAPKDQTILLYGRLRPHKYDAELYVNLEVPIRVTGCWDDIDGAWWIVGSTWSGPWIEPTHWMPLPEPPTKGAAE